MPKITIEQLNTILKTINPDEIKQSIIMQGYRCASELRKMEFSLMDILDGEEQGETDFYEDVFADSGYFAEIFTRVAGYERYVFIVVTKIAINKFMYNVWLMGVMYLPEKADYLKDNKSYEDYEAYNEYNKQKILQLLLIHDLGETVVGDIVRGEKLEDKKKEEREAMNRIIKKYFPQEAEEYYNLWKDAESSAPKNINAKIAKEIDYMQGVYQFCYYCVNDKVAFDSSDWDKWCKDIEFVKSSLGKEILEKVIFKNPELYKANSDFAGNIQKLENKMK